MRIRVCFLLKGRLYQVVRSSSKFFQVLPRSRLWQLLSRTIMSFWVSPRVPHCRRSVQNFRILETRWCKTPVVWEEWQQQKITSKYFRVLDESFLTSEYLLFCASTSPSKGKVVCMLPVLRAGLWMFVTGCNDVQWCAMMCNDVQRYILAWLQLCYVTLEVKKVLAEHPDKGGDPKKFPIAEQGSVCLGLCSRNQSNWNHVHFMFISCSIWCLYVLELIVFLKFSLGES